MAPVWALLLGVAVVSPYGRSVQAQAGQQGTWATLPYAMPINPVHLALMHDGNVLIVAGSGNLATETTFRAALWNRQAGAITTQTLDWDMFCNGIGVLPDGRVFINGGNLRYDPFYGERRSAAYDPATGLFTDLPMMAHGRVPRPPTALERRSHDGVFGQKKQAAEAGRDLHAGRRLESGYPAGWTPPHTACAWCPDGRVFTPGRAASPADPRPRYGRPSTSSASRNYGTWSCCRSRRTTVTARA